MRFPIPDDVTAPDPNDPETRGLDPDRHYDDRNGD